MPAKIPTDFSPLETKARKRALAKFEIAADRMSFKGAMPPEDWAHIEATYDKARARLLSLLLSKGTDE